ncbi:hypothetical protein L596_004740 [Steinernema carpocapsae]|uniref:Uncharacterized protein n=1 Tax=Steinernema carpocapsae TaxID=34508 RepID=A0A4U8UWQ5_STECR|nr:hypothetical protein L596_004740 [Steinernema carpocapsae]
MTKQNSNLYPYNLQLSLNRMRTPLVLTGNTIPYKFETCSSNNLRKFKGTGKQKHCRLLYPGSFLLSRG